MFASILPVLTAALLPLLAVRAQDSSSGDIIVFGIDLNKNFGSLSYCTRSCLAQCGGIGPELSQTEVWAMCQNLNAVNASLYECGQQPSNPCPASELNLLKFFPAVCAYYTTTNPPPSQGMTVVPIILPPPTLPVSATAGADATATADTSADATATAGDAVVTPTSDANATAEATPTA
ncbi:hypothetical protein HK101_002895 [Irineochytrium annulatum]|nr:hypothetical protein HK101_002895 [Irineochytrium annulatum]